MSQVYMTAKLNLADGTILYPQVSLDNIVASISDPTLVSVATTTNGKVPVAQLPTTLTVTESNTTVPTAGAVYTALGTKQNTLVEGDNIIHIIDGSTIMADITNLDVAGIDQTATNGVHLTLSGGNTVGVAASYVTGETAGVLAGVSDGIALDNGVISADVGSGLKIGADMDAGKVVIDEASVGTTLQDVRIDDGSTVTPVDDQVVTPGNLRGALSVGQAVDVSCPPLNGGITGDFDYLGTFTKSGTTLPGIGIGWYTAGNEFPKYADNLKYLFIVDVKITSDTTNGVLVYLAGTDGSGCKHLTPGKNLLPGESLRFAGIYEQNRPMGITLYSTIQGTYNVEFSHWRQYEVTALTDEAIAYIAQLPDPDAFFRAASVYSLRDKYLVKQDMVCPFIPTINMLDNSALTVAAGLSYKIKYTNDNPHVITADTIPTDGYGWDTHIQMFIKGTSSVVFQQPLILMDALTPNAGHNLSVKWRNGDALVYVDDINAGYIVVTASGTGAGTLNFGIVDPGTDYVIFAAGLDGTTVDAGTAVFGSTATTLTTLNILGNGTDATTITGNISAASGKTINFQDLSISGGTFGGAGSSVVSNVLISGPVEVASGSTVSFSGTNILNSTVSGAGQMKLTGDAVLTSIVPSGTTIGTGVIGNAFVGEAGRNVLIENMSFSSPADLYAFYVMPSGSAGNFTSCTFKNCEVAGTTTTRGLVRVRQYDYCTLDSCRMYDNVGSASVDMSMETDPGYLFVKDSVLDIVIPCTGGLVIFNGDNNVYGVRRWNGENRHVNVLFDSGSTTIVTGGLFQADDRATTRVGTFNTETKDVSLSGSAIISIAGITFSLSGCEFSGLKDGLVKGYPNIICGSMDTWSAAGAVFGSPLNASAAYTIKLTGTTFTSASKVLSANRIQLPASTTVSFQGNTNAADTKILDAPVILVGDDAAAPSGSATVVNAAGTTSTVSGIGTYIDKEGDNDFVPLTSVSTVSTSATSGAGSLPAALTGSNKFVRIADNTVGTVGEATNAVDKMVMTNDYEPIIGGTFSLTSATVDEATKITTILEGGTMSVVDIRGGKDSVIDLNSQGRLTTVKPGEVVNVTGVTVTGGSVASGAYGGVFNAGDSSGTLHVSNCYFTSNYADFGGVMHMGGAETNHAYFSSCTFEHNSCGDESYTARGILFTLLAQLHLRDCVFGDSQTIALNGLCTIEGGFATLGTVRGSTASIASGAVLDLTGNTNTNVFSGRVTFESGGATVLTGGTAGVVEAQYMMDNVTLPAGAKLTNTNAIDLGKTNVVISSGNTMHASGCTFTNGSGSHIEGNNRAGAVFVNINGSALIEGCVFSGNSAAFYPAIYCKGTTSVTSSLFTNNYGIGTIGAQAGLYLTSVTMDNNSGPWDLAVFNCNIQDCEISPSQDKSVLVSNTLTMLGGNNVGGVSLAGGKVVITGSNTIRHIVSSSGATGSVTISSGASINLTSSINPGSGVTFEQGGATIIPGGSSAIAYTLGGLTVPKIGNTNVIGLSSTYAYVSSNTSAVASNAIFSGGYASNANGGAVVMGASASFSAFNCVFDKNSGYNAGGTIAPQEGCTFVLSGCTATNNSAYNGGGVFLFSGASGELVSCTMSGNKGYTAGALHVNAGASVSLSGCTITGNIASSAFGGGLNAYGNANISACTISGNSQGDIRIASNTVLIKDSTVGLIATSGGTVTFEGTNTLASAGGGTGTVIISGGASITLTSSIAPGGGITVLEGGCIVNGNAVAAGTYTSIDSNGQPT